MAKFGQILSALRQNRGMTQKELAKILYVSDGTISNYENDVHYPDVEKLMDIANCFGVTTDYLLGRCKNNLSPDIFSEKLLGQRTTGDIIEMIQALDEDHQQALKIILYDMQYSMMLHRYKKDL
ncbi:MAG: helix-turn-helix transcriptional regulator [Eubacteriales bacterium]|nr:helix-turn-helix transcriptional regulator [Eubacteriales bacterium]